MTGGDEPRTRKTPIGETVSLEVADLGRAGYAEAYQRQTAEVERLIADRDHRPPAADARPRAGVLLVVEHDPVITVTRRPDAPRHVIATAEQLARAGVTVEETDRGGDVTYHGPGQLVVYPILDLNLLGLRLHEYMRLLEEAAMRTCAVLGVQTHRDATATGVWTEPARTGAPGDRQPEPYGAKIAAMGVRVRRWVSMHGLALNVDPDLEHFRLIVPCGLLGRPVTSLRRELADGCPPMSAVSSLLTRELAALVDKAASAAVTRRAG